ncbi:unnamed protein product [Trichogramma brassicae]|uniref:Uncharacterized protein n=1 Tax=Trichogramma brassicae TaxID=86971 RepID=A0A6H5IYG9_9HYME|nr:unnamed protein product [Trichogramma brassicae]
MVSGCWCPCVPSLGRRNTTSSSSSSSAQPQHQPEYYNHHQPAAAAVNGSSSAAARAGNNNKRRGGGGVGRPFSISAATERADMVQMFYYENRGKCCRKLLRYNGYPNKIDSRATRKYTETHLRTDGWSTAAAAAPQTLLCSTSCARLSTFRRRRVSICCSTQCSGYNAATITKTTTTTTTITITITTTTTTKMSEKSLTPDGRFHFSLEIGERQIRAFHYISRARGSCTS